MKKLLIITFAMVLTFALAGLTLADKVPTPTDPPPGVQTVSAADAENLMISGNAQVFDMRKALNYGKGHLPGAVSLPYKWTKKGHPAQRTGEFDMSKLPQDKKVTIVIHSDGPNGWKSYYASKAASEAGHKNVLWMREGFSTWAEKGFPVEN
jgi:rhodanese-related sulfurtransferase